MEGPAFMRTAASLPLGRGGLKIEWFESWREELDTVLRALPEMEGCPLELYRQLLKNPTPARKRIALITERGAPVALVGLRHRPRTRDWVPVTHYLLPAAVFPVREGDLMRVLAALGMDIWISWWGMEGAPPPGPTRVMERTPTYKVTLAGDFEKYWSRGKNHMRNVRSARNKCKNFRLEVDPPGSSEWTLRNWDAKWRSGPSAGPSDLEDRLLVARHLEASGRYHTLTLVDGETVTAAESYVIHRKEAFSLYNYRRPEYDRFDVGVRLLDLLFHWVADHGVGIEKMNLGGDYAENKGRWAPVDGEKYVFRLCPEYLYRAKKVFEGVRILRKHLTGWTP